MSKIRLNQIVMANMSATVLRNVVASVFKIRPESVILSGEIEPTRSFTGHGCWSDRSDTYSYNLWGFSPVKGFIDLNEYVGFYYNNTSGEAKGQCGTPLMHIPGVEEFVFFLVNENFDSGNGDDYDSFTWTLFKAPDFKKKWAEIEEKDIERWISWL
jgi:hypothetical protein